MGHLGYALVDADNHYYEPRDAFTRFMPASERQLAVHVDDNDDIAFVKSSGNGASKVFHSPSPATSGKA